MDRFDTIVVGAGMAGVTAATLLGRGGRRVVVLEARDRVGGRTWTDRDAGFSVDRGASWIHGVDGNPIVPLAEALQVRTAEFTVGTFQAGGRPIADHDATGRLMDDAAQREWLDDAAAVDAALIGAIEASVDGDTYRTVVERAISAVGLEGDRAERALSFHMHRVEEQCGAWIDQIDAHGLDEDYVVGDEVIFPDGYDVFATRLGAGLDIRLGQIVREIAWTGSGVTVRTDDAAFEADSVVVTVSLGVLKSGAIAFAPALPSPVAQAIERVGMGVFDKVFLQFPERFWEPGAYAIRLHGAAGWPWHSWYDVSVVSGRPTLLTFAAGPWGREVEGMADEEIAASVLEALRRMYGDAVPVPVASWITRWGQDPYALGSYSYLPVGVHHGEHDAMATPVGGVLHLAGEATWGEEPATVHSALLSGHRAAERILGRPVDLGELARALS